MIELIRDLRDLDASGRPRPDARVKIQCDRCGAIAPEEGLCDPNDMTAARALADWLRTRCAWKRCGSKILCPRCHPRRPRP